MKRLLLAALACTALFASGRAHADGATSRDSVYLVGEFVDPVCIYQHGMQGVDQKQCATVRGRVNQGIYFLDLRGRHLYSVIGMAHTDDPYGRFFDLLGDTVAVTGRVWARFGGQAIAITNIYPWRAQPAPRFAWWPWTWHVSTLVGCGVLALLYLLAMTRWRARLGGPPGFERGRATLFLSGIALVVVSLNGPIHDLSDQYFFSTHMIQHLLLAQPFPLLFLLGIPPWLAAALLRPPRVKRVWEAISDYRVGFALFTLVFTMWHLAPLYDLMMRDHNFHILMHLMTMASAVIMWWPFVGTAPDAKKLSPPAQMLYALVLSTPMMVVAAFLTFATRPLYAWYALGPQLWGQSPVEDQRFGALVMWIPGTMIYWAVISVIFLRWSHRENRAQKDDFVITPLEGRAPSSR